MTWNQLKTGIESAISQYEKALQDEETIYNLMREAENEMDRCKARLAYTNESSERSALIQQMQTLSVNYQQYQISLQQVLAAKAQAERYLQATRSELTKAIISIESTIAKIDQTISTYQTMASNPFGASAAAQLPTVQARRNAYQNDLNEAYALATRIDAVLNGGGSNLHKVRHR